MPWMTETYKRFIGPMPSEDWYSRDGQPYVCGYCGVRPTTKIASSMPECNYCWDWRKLDGPAARHWSEVTAKFLSNVDMYDFLNYFPAAGLDKQEVVHMFQTAKKLLDYSQEQIEEHTP